MSGHKSAVIQAMTQSPMFPPSFDGSPILFGLALCSRLVVMTMASAVIVRVMSRIHKDHGRISYAAHVRRLCILSLLWGALFGSTSDVMTWLAWGEVAGTTMADIMAASRFLDTLCVFPFIMALYVPVWAMYASRLGLIEAPTLFSDRSPEPPTMTAPPSLAVWACLVAILVTAAKWMAWHGAHAL